jgi:hypothetical protein
MATLWLEHRFGPELQSEVVAGTWFVRARALDSPYSLAVALMEGAESRINCVDVALHSEARPQIELYWDDIAAHGAGASAASGLSSGMALLELLHCAFDGVNCQLRTEDLEFVILGAGLALMQGDLTAVRHLRRLHKLAKEHGYEAAQSLAVEAMRSLYSGDVAARKMRFATRLLESESQPTLPTAPRVRIFRAGRGVGAHRPTS